MKCPRCGKRMVLFRRAGRADTPATWVCLAGWMNFGRPHSAIVVDFLSPKERAELANAEREARKILAIDGGKRR